ncbi:hypothetical protein [Hoeflea sp.]|uniref:hypothetical protein n=1 Tax=Hoeflea sp. TaxID=1940281 RepID=UPI003A8EF320
MLSSIQAVDTTLRNVELSMLLAMLVDNEIVPENLAIKLCTDLAELTRDLQTTPQVQPYTDLRASHYEDIASKMAGRGLLPRDPT